MDIFNFPGDQRKAFSKLSLVKNKLRSTMHQERLNHLMLMSLESDILCGLDFTNVIKDLSTTKTRRQILL
jgi:hypothetical protein